MNSKSILRGVLLVIVFGSVGVYALKKSQGPGADSVAGSAPPSTAGATVVVTYFTTDVRCDSCRTIEKLSRQAVEEGFPTEVASGAVVFRVLNTDRPENQHFVDDYQITNKTVIVSHHESGRETEWTSRQDVWFLFDEPEEFLDYVREPVKRYLAEAAR